MKDVLKYKDYIASVHYSTEDEEFFGRVEGINDLVTFEGGSVPELKAAFHKAVEDYLSIAAEIGKPAEKTYRGSVNVRLKPELHRKATRVALVTGKTLNEFINEAVAHEIRNAGDIPG